MTINTNLQEMSRQERMEALEDIVVSCLREALMMEEGENLPIDIGYFDLGLTSLRLSEARTRLQEVLGIPIDATVLFGQPTVEQLVSYLIDILPAISPGKEPYDAA
jgi:acyl carrier protein